MLPALRSEESCESVGLRRGRHQRPVPMPARVTPFSETIWMEIVCWGLPAFAPVDTVRLVLARPVDESGETLMERSAQPSDRLTRLARNPRPPMSSSIARSA